RWPVPDERPSGWVFAPDREIPEGSGVNDLAVTADGRLLVAALDEGAMVPALPGATPVPRLVVFRDRSWATLYADGRYVASAGAALSLQVEDPATHRPASPQFDARATHGVAPFGRIASDLPSAASLP